MAAILEGTAKVKIVALAPFPFVGAEFGGGERIYNLLTRIQSEIEVLVPHTGEIQAMTDKNLSIVGLPTLETVRDKEWDLQVIYSSKQVFGDVLQEINPDLTILEHPWQIDAIDNQRFIYDAHNNETQMKKLIAKQEMIGETERVETLALKADHVTYCSKDDNLVSDSPMTLIPNGVNLPNEVNKAGLKSKMLLFVGSAHPPNIGAAMTLVQLAPALLDYEIVIAGQCSQFIRSESSNVRLLGHVNKTDLHQLFMNAHAFVNLMSVGSGTSLKVIKAISYGLPVISSPIGARGYTSGCLIARNAQEVLDWLANLQSAMQYKTSSETNLEIAKSYSWDVLGARFNEVVFST